MKKEYLNRLSLIDGSIESTKLAEADQSIKEFEPLFEEILVNVLTLEGMEQVIHKRIVGFREREK